MDPIITDYLNDLELGEAQSFNNGVGVLRPHLAAPDVEGPAEEKKMGSAMPQLWSPW